MTGEDTTSPIPANTFIAGIILRPDELRQLTGRARPQAQLRWLGANGIPALRRADGQVVVLRSAIEAALGLHARTRATNRAAEPNWRALDAP